MPQNLDKFEQTVKNLIPCETFLQTLGRFLLYVVNNFYYQFAFPNAEEPHKKQKKKKTSQILPEHTRRHSLEKFIQIPCSFCSFQGLDITINK